MASGLVFLYGRMAVGTACFLTPGFPQVVLLLTVVMEEAEEMQEKLLKLPLQPALHTDCGEKSDGIRSIHSTPNCKYGGM